MGNGSVFCRTLQYNQGTPGLFNRLHRLLQLPFIVLLQYARQCAKYFTWIVSFNSHNNLMRYAIHPLFAHTRTFAQKDKFSCPKSQN